MTLTLFIQTPEGQQLCCQSNTTEDIYTFVNENLHIPKDLQRYHIGGKTLLNFEQLSNCCTITLFFALLGGKGGFGSLLKNQAQTRRKIINWDQSRDRDGRRIVNARNQNDLIDHFTKKQDELKKIHEQNEQVAIQQATLKANQNNITLDPIYLKRIQQNEKLIENSIKTAAIKQTKEPQKKIQKKFDLEFLDEINDFIQDEQFQQCDEPKIEKKVKV